ncbi:MAG: cyclic nucleotide-binding domain-containing protein [Verrucomicrobiales bacterium]|nr:cyclic nucleotide-binding domain-containing protein [Verrucomicrobiales bacterium]
MSIEASISSLPVISVPAGAEIISEGARLDRIYFLKSGRLEVARDGIRVNLIKTPGSVLGEISILLHQPSTATVLALDEVELYECADPLNFLKEHPEVTLHVSVLLASRLTAATQYLVDVKDQLKDCSDHVGMVDGVLDSILYRDLKKKL